MSNPPFADLAADALPIADSAGLLPLPRSLHRHEGTFLLRADTLVAADPACLPAARHLTARLRASTGYDLHPAPLSDGAHAAGARTRIALSIDPALEGVGPEGYALVVTPEAVTIGAAAPAGAFYGAQTLLQLLPTAVFSPRPQVRDDWSLPCVAVADQPRFGWRGAMLDVARHFLPVDTVKKFIDLLALHKMNRLHLHLTDDQGWRLEIEKYPELTRVGGRRDKTVVGRAVQNPSDSGFDPAAQQFDDTPHAGFYTRQQAREIVAYAAERHVMVVPEIEMPGHAQAAVAAYPELGCAPAPVEVSPTWGIHDTVFQPSEQVFQFLEDVLTEVMEIFPSPYIHVGGDEVRRQQWAASPAVGARMRELGLTSVEQIQPYFISRIDRFLTARGRRLIGWDEILEGGLADGAVVMSWRGEEGGIEAARAGHDAVMAPHQYTYLDFYQTEQHDSEPLALNADLPLERVYAYEPVPEGVPAELASHILGAQCQLWSEYMPTPEQMEYMAFPRLCALAEVTWSARGERDYPAFLHRLELNLDRLRLLRVNYRPLRSGPEIPYVVYRVE